MPNQLVDRVNQVQLQMDRLDCRVTELREEYLRVSDPKPAISE